MGIASSEELSFEVYAAAGHAAYDAWSPRSERSSCSLGDGQSLDDEIVPAWVLAAQMDPGSSTKQKIDRKQPAGMSCLSCSGFWQLFRQDRKVRPSVEHEKRMTLQAGTTAPETSSSSSSSHDLKLAIEESRDNEFRTLTSRSSMSRESRNNELRAETSRSSMMRHIAEASWSPTLCLYDASMDPHSPGGSKAERRAYHIPVSGARPCAVDNDNFTGNFIMLHRTPEADCDGAVFSTSPYDVFFAGKSRRWEVRVQGRFKKQPSGQLYTGCVLEDFDYSEEHSWSAAALATLVVPLMEACMGQSFYFSWGTRGVDIAPEEQELSTIVTSLAGVDQIIHTRAGEQAPHLQEDITGMGYCRNAMAKDDFRAAAQRISRNVNTEDTYTFCVWGCSPYIDCMRSQLTGTYALPNFHYGPFLDGWPAHFVLYSLNPDEQESRHLEKDKMYFIDIMVWGSDMEVPLLPERYDFLDARMLPEAEVPKKTT